MQKTLYHFVSKFEDAGNTHFVLKTWSKRKQRWFYEVYDDYILKIVWKIDVEKLDK